MRLTAILTCLRFGRDKADGVEFDGGGLNATWQMSGVTNITKRNTYMDLGGGAGMHKLRQAKDQSCMVQVGRHFGLLLGDCRQGAVGKERKVACKFQVVLEVDMGLHYTPGEDTAP